MYDFNQRVLNSRHKSCSTCTMKNLIFSLSLVAAILVSTHVSAVQCRSMIKSDQTEAIQPLKLYLMVNLAYPQIDLGIVYGITAMVLSGHASFNEIQTEVLSSKNIDHIFKTMTNAHKAHGVDSKGSIKEGSLKRLFRKFDLRLEETVYNTLKMLLPQVNHTDVRFRGQISESLNAFDTFLKDPKNHQNAARLKSYGDTILGVLRSKEMIEKSKLYREELAKFMRAGLKNSSPEVMDLRLDMQSILYKAVVKALKQNFDEMSEKVRLPLTPAAPRPLADLIGS